MLSHVESSKNAKASDWLQRRGSSPNVLISEKPYDLMADADNKEQKGGRSNSSSSSSSRRAQKRPASASLQSDAGVEQEGYAAFMLSQTVLTLKV